MRARLAVSFALLALAGVWQTAAAQEAVVLVADVSAATPAEHLLAVSLQGIANRAGERPRVFLITNPRDREWLDYCLRLDPRPTRPVTVDELLGALRPELSGQVLYDPKLPWTIDVATTAAGLRGAVITPTDLGLPTVLDLRGRWRTTEEAWRWARDTLLSKCSQAAAAVLPQDAIAMRDFAIQQHMFVLSPPAAPEDVTFGDIIMQLPPGTPVWGEAPPALRPPLSRASHYLVPAARAGNLSFLSQIDREERFYQYPGYMEPNAPRFLTLIFNCSDVGFAVNHMLDLWDHPARGTVPLGWALPAGLADAAPPVLHRIYADAYRSGMDGFVLGPSGAGEIDLAIATAPYAFNKATARACARLGIRSSLYTVSSVAGDLATAVTRFAAETGVQGVFLDAAPGAPPAVVGGVPALPAFRVSSVDEAISFLNNIPLDRRFAALLLDPRTMDPGDAAHIAAHVASRYLVVPPEEMLALMRAVAAPPQPGTPRAAIVSLKYPDSVSPDEPVPVRAEIDAPDGVLSASVIYRRVDQPIAFAAPMAATSDGFWAELPPLRCGGEFSLSVRAVDPDGRVAWCPPVTLTVARSDSDSDGLSDAEERLLLTDSQVADTDGDGLLDGNDPSPLRFDAAMTRFLGPIAPPSDAPYLADAGGSRADAEGRHLEPGQSCLYWLPLVRAPAGGSVVAGVEGSGLAEIAVGAEPSSMREQLAGDIDGPWYSAPVRAPLPQGGFFVRISCPSRASAPLVIRRVGAFSPPSAPSITRVGIHPAHPGPEQAVTISALIFSPSGVSEATLTYRVNGRGEIGVPMQMEAGSQVYQARIPALENRDRVEFWIEARDAAGGTAATQVTWLEIGSRSREVIALTGARDFRGQWSQSADWEGAGRVAGADGLRDTADANLTGGRYTVWVLAGGRGKGISVYLKGEKIGSIDPQRPDGWQQIGPVRVEAGRYEVAVVSEPNPGAEPGAAPRYGAIVFSADPTFEPPPGQVFDVYNSLSLLWPAPGETLSGRVDLRATGAGNVTAAEFSLDGEVLRRVAGPPFGLSLSTTRVANGPHTLRVEAADRAGLTGLAIEIPVTIAN